MSSLVPNLTYHVILFSKKMWYAIATKIKKLQLGGGKSKK